jgi:hypothetical protein
MTMRFLTLVAAALAVAVSACSAPDAELPTTPADATAPAHDDATHADDATVAEALADVSAATAAEVAAESAAAASTPPPVPVAGLPRVRVHKSPTCGCCSAWVQHMQLAGFAVEVVETDDLEPVRKRVGVPVGKASCHTAEVDGYFVEGHVPADDVKRLLRERPAARGLTVPGMPVGSPGMEVPSGETQPYAVLLVGEDGGTSEFARH